MPINAASRAIETPDTLKENFKWEFNKRKAQIWILLATLIQIGQVPGQTWDL